MTTLTTYQRAISTAIDSMRVEIKTLAVDANLCDRYAASYKAGVTASARRKVLLEAIKVLSAYGPASQMELQAGEEGETP